LENKGHSSVNSEKIMRRRTKFLFVGLLGLQLYCTPLMKAEPATVIGSDDFRGNQVAMLIDSLHTQEPPGFSSTADTVTATYYSRRFHGRKTANGETFDRFALTAAHKTLPFNTILKVTNPRNNKSVVVRINDRGPFKNNRKLDLSYGAAREIDLDHAGIMPVIIEILPFDSLDSKPAEG
jgi:rare lipoprotein A (peptidoglycan hydrolase)